MRVHVVHGHPVPDSFAATLHRTVLDGLTGAGHEVALYVARLRAAEALVFCFPTWCYAIYRAVDRLVPAAATATAA